MKILFKSFYIILIVTVIFISFLTFFSSRNFGLYRMFSIQSGSMEPSLKVGDLILIKKCDRYFTGDIITLERSDINAPRSTLTHRIDNIFMEDNKEKIFTKGDANNLIDKKVVDSNKIIGKVIYSIHFLGKLVDYMKTDEGLGLFIITPVAYIIFRELESIRKEIRNAKFNK